MDNAGVFTLAALQLTAATPESLLTPIDDLDGMSEVSLDFDFRYGSGTGTAIAIVATTFDGGTTWRQIARVDFAVASRAANCTLIKKSVAITSYADLDAEGVNDGILGDKLALILTTTGTYANTTLGVRASVS
jgi:hypothetical protein